MYLKSVRFMLWTALPVLVVFFIVLPQLLGFWIGGQFSDKSVWPARLIVIAQLVIFIDAMPQIVLFSRERSWWLTALVWLQAFLSVLFWKLLIPQYRLMGVALGTLLAQTVVSCGSVGLTHAIILKLGMGRYVRESLLGPFAAAGLAALFIFPFHGQLTTLTRLLGVSAGSVVVYYAVAWAFMSREDQHLLRGFLGRLRAKLL
jgi:hypothetical protein